LGIYSHLSMSFSFSHFFRPFIWHCAPFLVLSLSLSQIEGFVSLYLTNYLICHRPLHSRKALRSPAFIRRSYAVLAQLSLRYPPRLGTFRCITHPFATRHQDCSRAAVRLACVRHAASVQSEPGSNSIVRSWSFRFFRSNS